MKKLVAILIGLFICGNAFAYDADITGTCEAITDSARPQRCTYTLSTTVAQGEEKVFRIDTPYAFGNIREVSFESASTDCNVWISEVDAKTSTEFETLISMDGINLGYKPEFTAPVFFRNRDTTEVAYLYVTVDNDSATATGTSTTIVITYGSKSGGTYDG